MKRFRSFVFFAYLLGFGTFVSATLYVSQAQAVRFRRPFDVEVGASVYFGHVGESSCKDFSCGTRCYGNHGGTDFFIVKGTPVLAAAPGTVFQMKDGCDDEVNNEEPECGGRFGNHVWLRHADGMESCVAHLKKGTVKVKVGDKVVCGQHLGDSASSGLSSVDHVHFEVRNSKDVKIDPFAGECSQETSYWVDQGTYPGNIPSTKCESECECTAGETQTQTCGNCGTQTRPCGRNCEWDEWGECTEQGACKPETAEERPCCGDCGKEKRVCSANCEWGSWSKCTGENPDGTTRTCVTDDAGTCVVDAGSDAARTDSSSDSGETSEDTGEDSGCGCKLASSASLKNSPMSLPAPLWLMSGLFGLYWLRRRQ